MERANRKSVNDNLRKYDHLAKNLGRSKEKDSAPNRWKRNYFL